MNILKFLLITPILSPMLAFCISKSQLQPDSTPEQEKSAITARKAAVVLFFLLLLIGELQQYGEASFLHRFVTLLVKLKEMHLLCGFSQSFSLF